MSINAFQTQKVYYHTLDEGNCDPQECVHKDNETIFLVFFETGRNVPLQLKQTVTR